MNIYVSGSLAYDRLMRFAGAFEDNLLPDKLHMLNVCFFIEDMELKRGGTAGNIAYTLALLGEKPLVLSAAGKDFGLYEAALKRLKLSRQGIRLVPEDMTASAFIITDKNNNQITAFAPAAMRQSCLAAFSVPPGEAIAIVSPGNMDDMVALPRLYRERGIRYIFDPGQQIPALSGQQLCEALEGAFVCITNEYELDLLLGRTGLSKRELCARVEWLVTTRGGQGSLLYGAEEAEIAAVAPEQVLDPTGAGDAYRAGLIKGLCAALPMREAAQLGALCATYCVECQGTQEHSFTRRDLLARYKRHFGAFSCKVF